MVGTDEEDLFSSALSPPLSISVVMVFLSTWSVSLRLPLRETLCAREGKEKLQIGLTWDL